MLDYNWKSIEIIWKFVVHEVIVFARNEMTKQSLRDNKYWDCFVCLKADSQRRKIVNCQPEAGHPLGEIPARLASTSFASRGWPEFIQRLPDGRQESRAGMTVEKIFLTCQPEAGHPLGEKLKIENCKFINI